MRMADDSDTVEVELTCVRFDEDIRFDVEYEETEPRLDGGAGGAGARSVGLQTHRRGLSVRHSRT